MCEINIENEQLCICAIYAPNKDTPAFFTNLFESTLDMSSKKVFIGDFNLALDTSVDRTGTKVNNSKAAAFILETMEDLQLSDVWRECNLTTKEFSYFRKKPMLSCSRIDFVLISRGLDTQVTNCTYLPGLMTDHSAFYLAIELVTVDRRRGYWKFNNTLLYNRNFLEHMNTHLEVKIAEYNNLPPQKKWEMIKFECINQSQKYAENHTKDKNMIISMLYDKVDELELKASNMPEDNKVATLLEATKLDLNDFEEDRAKGIIFRTKARWNIEGERNTKYYFGLTIMRESALC